MNFQASFSLPSYTEMIRNFGLEETGPVQTFFTEEVRRLSDDYVPMDSGMLKNNVTISLDGTFFTYETIYALYQWYGNLMVDPDYQVGAFPITQNGIQVGFFSRPNINKVLDPNGRKLNNFNGIRGPFWVDRMWADRQNEIVASVQRFVESRKK